MVIKKLNQETGKVIIIFDEEIGYNHFKNITVESSAAGGALIVANRNWYNEVTIEITKEDIEHLIQLTR